MAEPLVRQPQPIVSLSAGVSRADLEINHFDYAADVPDVRVHAAEGPSVIEGAPADVNGERCPHFAHIRKVNLRDKLTDQGPSFRFRMLRRGIPYGPPFHPAGRMMRTAGCCSSRISAICSRSSRCRPRG